MLRKTTALSGLLVSLAMTAGCIAPPVMKPYVETFPPPPAPKDVSAPDALELQPAGKPGSNVERPAYRVGPLDRISVRVWGRPELGSQVPLTADLRITVVAQDGTIRLPFLGAIYVAGNTVAEISALVAAGYTQVVESPQVETFLESCSSQTVEVDGSVRQPGTQHLCDTVLTVGEVLRAAGGTAPDADAAHAILIRDGVRYRLDLWSTSGQQIRATGILLHDHDVVYVPSTQERLVYLFGELVRPGTYAIPEKGLTLVEALGLAGGYNPSTADVKMLYLARMVDGDPTIYKMTVSDLLTNADVGLAPGDRVLLTPRKITQWNRWIRQLFPNAINPEKAATGGGNPF